MEGMDIFANLVVLTISIIIVALITITSLLIATIVRRHGRAGLPVRRVWFVLSVLATIVGGWYVIQHLSPWD